jgi:hypothetical protein
MSVRVLALWTHVFIKRSEIQEWWQMLVSGDYAYQVKGSAAIAREELNASLTGKDRWQISPAQQS